MEDDPHPQEESIPSQIWERLVEFLRIFPVLILLVVAIYTLSSSARQTIDGFILTTPAKDLVTNYDNYPSFLDEGDIVVKKTVFNDSGKMTEGLIIEIHNPAALAKTSTESMQPMFGPGNLLVQEKVDSTTQLNPGDIVIYEKDGSLIIHQIISENNGCYTTKGFNNPVQDGVCVTKGMIKYRLLFAIPTK